MRASPASASSSDCAPSATLEASTCFWRPDNPFFLEIVGYHVEKRSSIVDECFSSGSSAYFWRWIKSLSSDSTMRLAESSKGDQLLRMEDKGHHGLFQKYAADPCRLPSVGSPCKFPSMMLS